MDPSQLPGQLQFVPQFNASVPPFAMHPPFNTAPPAWNSFQDPTKLFNDTKVDPKILAKAQEWTEHRAPDGRPYFYNASIQQSTWERPQALKDLDEARMAQTRILPPVQPLMMTQGNVTFDSSGQMINKQRQAELEAEKKRKEEAEKAKSAKPIDKTRPIASTPISGTPWCVVWTGDSRVFFYCPSTRTSVWERPEDLIGEWNEL
jgi:transcription elongation regulator 1